MSTGARVESIDALKTFKVQLIKFAEGANVALGDAESEMHRTLMWLELEAQAFWQGQIRKRTELLSRAQEALRQKQLFKDAAGRHSSAPDEMKMVALCKRRLEEANEKLILTKQHTRRLQKEIEVYKGSVQRFATTVQGDIPVWAAKLERMVTTLESYVALTTADAGPAGAGSSEFSRDMTRAAAEAAGFGSSESSAPVTAVPLAKEDYPKLRVMTPTGHFRERAKPAFMSTAGWGTRLLNAEDRRTMGALSGPRLPFNANDTVIVGPGTVESTTIYLERVEGRGPGDSQWYVGAARIDLPKPPEEVDRVGAADFLATRPDFLEALTLPKGSLVIVTITGVLAVLDRENRNLWPAKSVAPPQKPVDEGIAELGAGTQ